jgi:hypothetical protein
MTTALYLILSGILIGAGISIIWRDVRKQSRGSFVSERDAQAAASHDVEVTIARGTDPELTHAHPRAAGAATRAPRIGPASRADELARAALSDGAQALAGPAIIAQMDAGPSRHSARLALERQWSQLAPAMAAAIARTNTLLAPVRLCIGPAGEPAWSYKNRGFGIHRRLLLEGESVAWLRLELLAEGRLRAHLKAHRDDRAHLNAGAEIAAVGLDGDRIGELLVGCLEPATSFAARHIEISEEEASRRAWASVNGAVAAALSATNGALAQVGARLIELAPAAWENDLRRHRMALAVEVNGEDVARMHIEQLAHELEVAVGVREPQLAALGRRRRIPVDGMTIHALAELIASCAWPAIARFKETRRQA